MVKKILGLGIVFLSFLSSCTYDNEETLYGDVCDTSKVTYTNDILPVFQQNCYSCHHDGTILYGNLDLVNFSHIQRVVDSGKLLKNIKHEPDGRPMPEGGTKLPDCTILKIENWIDQGIPQN